MRLAAAILYIFSSLCFAMAVTLATPLLEPGCGEKCGNVSMPYPFGIGSACSANPFFTVVCQNFTTPFLYMFNMEVVNISLYGTVTLNQPLSPVNCSAVQRTGSLPISLKRSPFTISARYNSLAVLGCKNSVWLRANETTVGGCTAMCDANSTDTSCNGVNCCQTNIPRRLQELKYDYQSIQASNGSCGYVFPVDKKWLQKDYERYRGLLVSDLSNGFAPLVLEWEFEMEISKDGKHCISPFYDETDSSINYSTNHSYQDDIYRSSTRYCTCSDGFEGNPYLPQGCRDIDECATGAIEWCTGTCINTIGGFICKNDDKSRLKIAFISIGSALGALVLLLAAWKSARAIRERIKANRKHKFFKRNGGLLLEQQLSATDNGLEKTKLFSSRELTQATDHYNENRVLGRGGQGTVYKGMLADGRIVAVKKSKEVEEGDVEVFINEVVILSQVNHRNVVKLMGCCLETEVPLLVYEFVPNGTLFQHIHEPNEEFPLTWEMRMRIAREVAGALAYLHSAASTPIFHRDIKSTNILLDDKYRAKVSDFGTSRSVAIDQTHLTTRVLGTFGYLDPEYFQSSQFSDKSNVYSFGVVLVELLTGEKAISSMRVELGRSLATHFLHSMEKNQLFDILDTRVLKEGKREDIVAIAELARRCLHLNGKRRPTMKEAAVELEGTRMTKGSSSSVQNYDDSRDDESCNFSSVIQGKHLDTITLYASAESDSPLLGDP